MTMANEGQQGRDTASPTEETAIRGSGAWMAVQQGAQVIGELGGGIGGIALAVQVAKQSKGSGPSSQSGGGQGPTGGDSKK
jgi:hypothetical protein